jgi:hypothetical protein
MDRNNKDFEDTQRLRKRRLTDRGRLRGKQPEAVG